MNKIREIVILVMVPVFYLLGTFSIIRQDIPMTLLSFCAESVLMAILCIIFATKSKGKEDAESVDEEIILVMEQTATEQKQRISALEKELKEKAGELDEMTRKYTEENLATDTEKETLRARIEALESKEPGEGGIYDFLPPVPEEESSETIDIIKTARDTVKELEEFAQRVSVLLEVSAAEGSLLVRADRSRMRIMFRNIIDNSIKYMQKAGRLIITISSIGDDIFIVLKDNGLGLDAEETKHIFELNYQGSNRISGNGLGLAQARAIVEYYGGTIYAKSNKDRGMGIYIQLPTT